jgi:threonine aldolase
MLKAMAEAQVGDDVFGEDPTINKLEEMAADRLGKEAALFVASGTMGNLVSLLAHCGRGDEIIPFSSNRAGLRPWGGFIPGPLRTSPTAHWLWPKLRQPFGRTIFTFLSPV